jgi:hypothetical protein
MDAKTRNLVLLGVLSLFCAGFLWSSGRAERLNAKAHRENLRARRN